MNWKGEPLSSYETVINLINGTKTRTGLRVRAELTAKQYKKGQKVSDDQMKELRIQHHKIHPKWNYTIRP